MALVADSLARRALEDELSARLVAAAQAAAAALPADRVARLAPGDEGTRTYGHVRARLESVARATGTRLFVVRADRTALADSAGSARIGEPVLALERDRVEIAEAARGRAVASQVLFEGSDGRLYKTGYAPLRDAGRRGGRGGGGGRHRRLVRDAAPLPAPPRHGRGGGRGPRRARRRARRAVGDPPAHPHHRGRAAHRARRPRDAAVEAAAQGRDRHAARHHRGDAQGAPRPRRGARDAARRHRPRGAQPARRPRPLRGAPRRGARRAARGGPRRAHPRGAREPLQGGRGVPRLRARPAAGARGRWTSRLLVAEVADLAQPLAAERHVSLAVEGAGERPRRPRAAPARRA